MSRGPVLLLLLLAACGDAGPSAPRGPYASPSPLGADATIARACASNPGPQPADVQFVGSVLPRQDADLQRVADDITGAVPGGDLGPDATLARSSAHAIADLVDRSSLCPPFKSQLARATHDLVTADDALSQSPGAETLGQAQAAEQALKALVENPPRASPAP